MRLQKNTLFIAGSTLILGILIGWFLFAGNSEGNNSHQQHTDVAGSNTFTCSMHPQIRQNEPGDCPICGMALIPLEEEGAGINANAVRMSPTAMQLAGVQTAIIGSSTPSKRLQLQGKVQVDERLISTQSTHIPGRIERLMVDFVGTSVSQGQILAYIYSPELITAQEELLEAKQLKSSQPALFQAAQDRLKSWKITQEQINQVLNTGKPIEQLPVIAEVSGVVSKQLAKLGDYLKLGAPMYEITDLSRVWIAFDIYESDMAWIKKGQKIDYSISALPGEDFEGKIDFIDPTINPQTRVAKAWISSPNKGFQLKPEMFVAGLAESRIAAGKDIIAIPKSAVMWTGKRSVVYVKSTTDQGVQFEMREVVLGPALGKEFIVQSGLESGEEIAAQGAFSIDAAAQLAGKPSMMSVRANAKDMEVSSGAKKSLEPLFKAYFSLKNALSQDDFQHAQQAGVQLRALLDQVATKSFSEEANALWSTESAILSNSLEHFQHYSEIAELRDRFLHISKAMISLIDGFHPLGSTIFVQYCPMANSNSGAYWLSQEDKVINPYFGASMLSCGEVKRRVQP